MRYVFPGIVFSILLSAQSYYHFHSKYSLPSSSEIHSEQSAQNFIQYVNTISAFQIKNPAFLGSIGSNQISTLGNEFPGNFLSKVNNRINAFGNSGRTLIISGELQVGALGNIIDLTEADASYGISNGNTWVSINGNVSELDHNIPIGHVVYIVRIGR